MGLCNSKRDREQFDSTNSAHSYVSNISTQGLNPSKNNVRPRNGEETINESKDDETELPDDFKVEDLLLRNVWNDLLFSSPIEENLRAGNLRVLDVVCGSGYWTYSMASKFSRSQFTGIHASPTMEKFEDPLNASVVRIDILGEMKYKYGDNSFDYVHMRALSPRFTDDQWKQIVSQMVRITKAGGYCEIEVGDYGGFENESSLMKKIIDAHRKCLEIDGIKTNVLDGLEQIMKDTCRFSSVQMQLRTIPIGKSTGEYGEMASKHFTRVINSQRKHISSYLGLEDFDGNMSEIITELNQYQSTCLNSVRVFGQKIKK